MILNNRQHKNEICVRREIKKMSSMTNSALCPEEIYELTKGGGTKQCLVISLSRGVKNEIWRG